MGRDWSWGSGSKSSKKAAEKDQATPAAGCISAVFHLFDFHHFQFSNFHHQATTNHVSLLPQEPTRLKGAEAPRNSLESSEESSASSPSTSKEEESLKIPAMGIRVKTSRNTRTKSDGALNNSNIDSCSESEINYSSGAKTPNLVARLMGLDLLPDNNSISPSSNSRAKPHFHPRKPTQNKPIMITRHRNSLDGGDIAGTRSLPETPRISSARRSDVDYHHRLSLQINKENMSSEEENRRPSLLARQIVKQVKESVGRKVGMDITNTVKSRGQQARDELKSQEIFKKSAQEEPAATSSSPRLRFLETKTRTAIASSTHKDQSNPQIINPQNLQSLKISPRRTKKFKNYSNNTIKFDIRLKKPQRATDIIRNKQEEPFVRSPAGNRADVLDKKCKKTPLSPQLLNISVPTLLHVKKEPSLPKTKIKESLGAQKSKPNRGSSPLSCSSSQAYKEEATHAHATRDRDCRYGSGSTAATTGDESGEREYVTTVLRRTGIDSNIIVPFATWFSPSNPLDPSIFYHIEHIGPAMKTTASGQLGHRCNRKLMFDLVDTILAEILKPYLNKNMWGCSTRPNFLLMKGTQLVEALISKLRSFPRADCRVLEDIDALVEMDLEPAKVQNSMAMEDEGEGIVMAIEEEILERLIEETATGLIWDTERCRFGRRDGERYDHMVAHVMT